MAQNSSEIRYLTPPTVEVQKKKYCRFKKNRIKFIDYKDPEFLKKFLNEQGKINLYTNCQIASVSGDKNIDLVKIKHDDGDVKELKTDYVLGFFGLIMQLGPILDWGLNIDKKRLL